MHHNHTIIVLGIDIELQLLEQVLAHLRPPLPRCEVKRRPLVRVLYVGHRPRQPLPSLIQLRRQLYNIPNRSKVTSSELEFHH